MLGLFTPAPEHPFTTHLTQAVPKLSDVAFYSYNLSWLQGQVDNAIAASIPATSVRATANINLDKIAYRPNDNVFVEVELIDAQTRTPLVLTEQQ